MSAIAGLYALDMVPVDAGYLHQMAAALAHRGTSTHVWQSPTVGFVQVLRATTPEACCEQLPLAIPTQDLVLCADARLDNRTELLGALNFDPSKADEIPDGALLHAAYQQWGEGCVTHLIGDFSFAIWDAREQHLFCARDPMGIRPFYYYDSPQVFGFATELRALLALPFVSRALDDLKIVDHLLLRYHDKSSTFYRDLRRLPSAHTLIVSPSKRRIQRYWALDALNTLHLPSDEAYAEQFLELFTQAVRCRLRTLDPVGALLSGGLDSSSVTLVAAQQQASDNSRPIATFSGLFPRHPEIDEKSYIDQVLARQPFVPHFIAADTLNPLSHLSDILRHVEQPHLFPNLFMIWELFGLARAAGVGVMLDGTDGDVAVSHGHAFLRELAYAGQWQQFATLSAALQSKYPASGHVARNMLAQFGFPTLIQLAREGQWGAVIRALPPIHRYFQVSYRQLLIHQLAASLLHPADEPTALLRRLEQRLAPAFRSRVDLHQWWRSGQSDDISPERTERHFHINGIMNTAIPEILETHDKVSAAFGLDMRHPFFDQRLLAYCVSLPAAQKIDNEGWTRLVLRHAMADILPSAIQWRPGKANLAPNYGHALNQFGRDELEATFITHPAPLDAYLDIPLLQATYRRFTQHPSDSDGMKLWAALGLHNWLRAH